MNTSFWQLGILILGAMAAALAILGVRHLLRGKGLKAVCQISAAAVLAALSLALALVTINLASYARLTFERPLVQLTIHAVAGVDKSYIVSVQALEDGIPAINCELSGDEWILSARVQKWQPWLNLLGVDTTYSLDQLANKYATAADANQKAITACDLGNARSGDDWGLPKSWVAWAGSHLRIEQRRFGSATYMPLADDAVYVVLMTQSGLNAEPLNAAARRANDNMSRM
ncbi:MAG: hypothetical protein K1X51_00645 [Rhodospirillaceae bacterium]|nr:hypothetical protein [Rhodospirillaceae bacterium]